MPQIIKQSITKLIEKNGELELSITIEPIVIELTINVNNDGSVNVGNNSVKSVVQNVSEKEEEIEPISWAVPTFGSQKIKFGKNG